LVRLEQQLTSIHPDFRINRLRQELVLLSEQAERRMTQQLHSLARGYGEATARLEGLSPLHTLARGYAVVARLSDGIIIRNAADLTTGDKLDLKLHQGHATCLVEKTYSDSGGNATT